MTFRIGAALFFLAIVSALSVSFSTEKLTIEDDKGRLLVEAPEVVTKAVEAANRIVGKPYKYGGGHGEFEDEGYDCSGSTSYVLNAAGLLEYAMPSANFLEYGEPGPGEWITVWARAGHVFVEIAGARFDTTDHENIGPGWREAKRDTADKDGVKGFTARHPKGL